MKLQLGPSILTVAVTSLLLLPGSAFGADLRVDFSLDHSKVPLGEPVVLRYTLHNAASVSRMVDFGADQAEWKGGWLDIKLVDAKGKTVARDRGALSTDAAPATPLAGPFMPPGGIRMSRFVSLAANGDRAGEYVITRRVAFPASGSYTIVVHSTLDLVGDDSKDTPVKTDYAAKIEITPPDPAAQAKYAAALRDTIQSGGVREASAASSQLAEMSGDAAMPAWRSLVLDNAVDDHRKAEFLGFLTATASPDAIRFLGEMTWNMPGAWEQRPALSRLYYYSSDNPIKEQIRRLFESHGEKLPAAPIEGVD